MEGKTIGLKTLSSTIFGENSGKQETFVLALVMIFAVIGRIKWGQI